MNLEEASFDEIDSICSLPIGFFVLHGKKFTDKHLNAFSKAKAINGLGLYDTSCTDSGLARLAKFPGLRELHFDKGNFTAKGWRHLRQIPELHKVYAYNYAGSDAHISSLTGHPRLNFIFIGSCGVTGKGFRAFRGKPQLESIVLAGCALDSAGLQAIAEGLPELKSLTI